MRAAGAERGGALNDFLYYRKPRAAGFAEAAEFGAQSAVAQLRGNFFDGLNEWDDFLGEDGVVQAARVRNSFSAAGEALAEKAIGDVGRRGVIEGLKSRVSDILLKEAAALFD